MHRISIVYVPVEYTPIKRCRINTLSSWQATQIISITRNTFCGTRYLSHSHCHVSAFCALTSWCTSAKPAYSV